jgi:hypothetical protein
MIVITIGLFLAVLPRNLFFSTFETIPELHEWPTSNTREFSYPEEQASYQENLVTPKRYIVFLPDEQTSYPWPDNVLYRYKLLPAILVSSTPKNLFKWLSSVPGTRAYPDISYKRSFVSKKVTTSLSSPSVDPRNYVNTAALHAAGINGSGVRIGIIDTGVGISGKVVAERSFVNSTFGYGANITSTADIDGHGTKVAFIAAGTTGIAPEAKIVSAKIFHGDVLGNAGEPGEETTSALYAAIEYCIEQDSDVINLSIGQYHNLVDDGRAAIIDYFSRTFGVVFSISAGNEGNIPYCSGTLSNPGSTFQAITVASYNTGIGNLASSSGTGPRPDYTMKPDVSAPGVDISTPIGSISGTSAAAPVVSGAAALLIHYLNKNSLSYSPGTVKAAILEGASDIKPGGTSLPPDYQGAGLLDVENAWNSLVSASTTGSEVDLLASHPNRLPFRPFTTLFTGESVAFNATVVSSRNVTATISLEGNSSAFISLSSTTDLSDSTRLPVNFTVPDSAITGHYSGKIILTYGSNINTSFQLEFDIREPQKRVLFDEKHTVLTYRPYSGIGSWGDTNFLSGMFREYATSLIDRNISITPFREGLLTSSLLQRYDALVLNNPCSWITDRYTDWINVSQLIYDYAVFHSSEYDAIEDFVKEQGGGLLVFTLGSETVNVEALNGLIERFGISLTNSQSSNYGVVSDFSGNFSFLEGVSGYSHYGSTLATIGGSSSFAVAYHNSQIVAAGNYYNSSKGRVMVFATEYLFNNLGMNEFYHSGSSNNKILAIQVTEWICDNSDLDLPPDLKENLLGLNSMLTLCFLISTSVFLVMIKKKSSNGDKKSS